MGRPFPTPALGSAVDIHRATGELLPSPRASACNVAWGRLAGTVASRDVACGRLAGTVARRVVVQWALMTSTFRALVSTASMPGHRALPLAVLGRPRKTVGEPRVPFVPLAFTTPTTVVVIVAVAAMGVSRRRVVAVARHPFSIHDPVVPRVDPGSSSTAVSVQRVLHHVKVHQHPEGESSAVASGL